MADLIVNNDLTTVSLTGSGVFDILMQTATLHLTKEMQAGRITGASYTQAYMAAMQYAMQNAVQFVTSSKQINGQLHLLEQQTLTEVETTAHVAKQTLQTVAATSLIDQQTLTETQQTGLVTKQILATVAGTALTEQQTQTEVFNTTLTDKRVAQTTSATLLQNQQTLTEAVNTTLTTKRVEQTESATLLQNQQTQTELRNTNLVEQKVVTEKAQTSDEIDTVPVAGTIKVQNDQIRSVTAQNNASTALIEQKRITEAGQTTNNTEGILGAQQQLYIAQKEGFEFDKVYKFASKLSDVWISRLSLDTVSDIGAAGMGDASILAAINELRSAVGLAHIAG